MKRIINKKNKICLLTLAISLMPSLSLKAQNTDTLPNKFSLSLNFRPKLEIRDGAFRPLASNENVAALVSDRLRLNIDYSYKNLLSIRVAPQAVSVWGQANMVQGAESVGNKLSLFETWAKLRISNSWYTQIGRQVISLDDERIFGALDWAQGGRVHDAVSVHFSKKQFEVKGFFAYNQNYKTLYGNNLSNPAGYDYVPTDAYPHKWMQTVWASLPINDKNKITLLATNLGFQTAAVGTSAPEYYAQTYGANYFFNGPKINAQVAGYFQGGKNAVGQKTEAFTATANIGYNIDKNWGISLGGDIISGNNIGIAKGINNAFNPYFSTGHKFYGFMDYYYAGNAHKGVGILDNYFKLNFKHDKGVNANLVLHQFLTPNKLIDPLKKYDRNLGQEIDLTISYKINKFVTLVGGYSLYLTTPSIKYLKNVLNANNVQQWAWVSINVTPTLFEYKGK
jgi:hypothetical protein